jgi:DNA-binding beta-propeller fold protein YncE
MIGLRRILPFAAAAIVLADATARAQIVVSANVDRTATAGRRGDTATVLDLSVSPPRVMVELKVPAAVQGPPQSVAIAPDESIALVTSATRPDPANPSKQVPDDTLTVIDLKATPPTIVATLHAGMGATGVSINQAGTLALVANRSEGTVSVFTIQGTTVQEAGKASVCDASCEISLPVFTPDGKRALVTRFRDNRISVLSVTGTTVQYTKVDIAAGLQPYGLEISPRGDFAIVANVGAGLASGGADIVSLVDLTVEPPRVVDNLTVGPLPEGISLSPDGRYLAVSVMNHSQSPKTSPFFHDFGYLKIARVEGKALKFVAEIKVGHWGQGVAWSKDGRTLLLQAATEQELEIFTFDGQTLKPSGVIAVGGSPAGIRTAR